MSSESGENPPVIGIQGVGKLFEIYDRPIDRLKQAFQRGRRKLHREFWALHDVSLEVRKGEALGVIGRNGSGKSTLLQIVAGTLRPTVGTIQIRGRVAALLELGSGFNPEFTGRENVYLNGTILGLSREEIDKRYESIAEFADIGDYVDQPIKTYSTGMVMRLAFAVQVQVEPDILIIDEALAVGDALFQKRCFQKMEQMRQQGVTLLFVSHDQESVRTLTTKALLLEQGRTLAYGDPSEVVLEYRRLLHKAESDYFDKQFIRQQQESAARSADLNGTAAAAPDPTSGPGTGALPEAASDDRSFGDFSAELLKTEVFNDAGEASSTFYPLDKIRIRVTARANRALTHLNVGLRIRNKQGVKMYSWGTLNQDIAIWAGLAAGPIFWDREFSAGETFSVDFEFVNSLGWNFYEIQTSIAEERDRYYNDQHMLHWRDESAFLQVLTRPREHHFGGVCDLKMMARWAD